MTRFEVFNARQHWHTEPIVDGFYFSVGTIILFPSEIYFTLDNPTSIGN